MARSCCEQLVSARHSCASSHDGRDDSSNSQVVSGQLESPDCGPKSCCQGITDAEREPESVPQTEPVTGDDKSASAALACAKGCCGTSSHGSTDRADDDAPDCCRGKAWPCCDDSCLERLALRECRLDAKSSCGGGETKSSCCRVDEGGSSGAKPVACDSHRKSTRQRYGVTLEALGCICRALLALGQESCCETRKRPLTDQRAASKRSSTRSLACSSFDSCCVSGRAEASLPSGSDVRTRKAARACREETAKSACSLRESHGGTDKVEAVVEGSTDSCCGAKRSSCQATAIARKDDSEGSFEKAIRTTRVEQKDGRARSLHGDPENQTAGEEHAVLCVSGMTCTGCETKLNRTLATVSGVKNLKTSLVLSRAEFDVDLHLTTVGQVIKHLERTTEFKCERITSDGSGLDVIVPADASDFMNRRWPDGVMDMARVSKDIVRISFDPTIIGARDLLAQLGEGVSLAPVCADTTIEAGGRHVRNVGYVTLASALLTVPVLVMAWAPLPERELVYGSASLALATIVQVFIAGPFYPKALKALVFSRVFEMDLLIVLSTSAAYVFSVVSFGYLAVGKPLSTGQFFETSTLLVTLIMVGRYVAALARQKAVESISIRSLQAQTALLVQSQAPEEQEIDIRLLQHGDLFKVLPDTKIPTDGTVVQGSSEVDESLVTGEHLPVEKGARSHVIAGTVNGSGVLVARVTRLPGDNTINTIAAMVDEAKLSKPRMQQLADRVASRFVPVIVALTIVTFVAWVSVGVTVQGKTGSESAIQAITYAVTVLIVSCPCAIGLAVPMVVVIASGVAAERGVIYKTAEAIEVAYKTSHVVFDKTGTLTEGKLKVTEEFVLDESQACLHLLSGLVSHSRHPISEAIKTYLTNRGITGSVSSDVKSLVGQGLEASMAGRILRAGNSRWTRVTSHPCVQKMLGQGRTVFCFTIDSDLKAVYGLEDSLRADARETIATLIRRGVSVHLLSGDDDGAVQSVTAKLGIRRDQVQSRSSPGDKQAYVKALVQGGGIVMFCGDGTNDAVALAQATVGVHMNHGGSDVARCAVGHEPPGGAPRALQLCLELRV
ncbi:hypothetical protein HIM_02950 [Hirsutella minnesotensis 3608]|nr:hypothetical protein HIM_02950 [Hirsutella minnesotensis 3608]